MKTKNTIGNNSVLFVYMVLASFLLFACKKELVDDRYSRNQYNLELTSSAEVLILNEDAQEDVALTLEWTPATDLGSDFIVYYNLEIDYVGKSANNAEPISQYVDDVNSMSFTHRELQDMLVSNWSQPTNATGSLRFTVTATYEGPRLVIPETSTVEVKMRTYGPIQFAADRLFMEGTAVGDSQVEMFASANNANVFVQTVNLSAGTLSFPVMYSGESENSIGPVEGMQEISSGAMLAGIDKKGSSGAWVIKEPNQYRVTVNFENQTVSVVPAQDIIEVEKIFIQGSAVDADTELLRTLEDDNVFAFRGELKAGSLYFPILFEGEKLRSIVPNERGVESIMDGNTVIFSQIETQDASVNHWNIPSAGTYRIVVNIETKTVTIYSAATDLTSKKVSWNNTVIGVNPFVSEVETLWMYGSYNNFAGDGNGFSGFDNKYTLMQSLANPDVFVYKGEVLPRSTKVDDYGKSATGAVNFTVSNIHNNVFAFGSKAAAERLKFNGYEQVVSGAAQSLVEGQGNNRYSYFLIPENTNFVMVNVKTLTVVFAHKE